MDLRSALAGRLGECWERLEDVVVELCALHEVDADTIVARVRDVADAESSA